MSVGVGVEQMLSPYVRYMAGVTQAFLHVCVKASGQTVAWVSDGSFPV